MNCTEVELALEQDGLEAIPEAARTHLADCSACQSLVADFLAIGHAAREVPAEVAPPVRLWVSLRAQLEAEGLIRGPVAPEKVSWRESFAAFWRRRALATAAAGLVIVFVAAVEMRRTPTRPPAPAAPASISQAYAESAALLNKQEEMALASAAVSPVDVSLRDNLQIVKKFISDCEQRVQEEPGDDAAREYLSGAYQQKAELLAAMMDRSGGGD